jgi:hypothetical protein
VEGLLEKFRFVEMTPRLSPWARSRKWPGVVDGCVNVVCSSSFITRLGKKGVVKF